MRSFNKIKHLIRSVPHPLWQILGFFLTTRVVLTIIGLASRALLDRFSTQHDCWQFSSYPFLDLWGVWDTGLYTMIASQGYPEVPVGEPIPFSYGFFPLYPLVIKLIGFLLRAQAPNLEGFFHSGVIISNLSLLLSSFYLYKLLRLDESESTALRSVKYLFFFPSAMFLSSVYPEVLILLLVILAFYSARKQHWWLAGIFGFCAALTRPEGCLLFFPLAAEYAISRRQNRQTGLGFDSAALLFIPLGLITFLLFCFARTGTTWAPYLAKVNILPVGVGNPFLHLYRTVISRNMNYAFNGWAMLLTIIFLFPLTLRLRSPYAIFTTCLLSAHLITLGSLVGSLRHLTLFFPLYLVLAKISEDRVRDDFIMIICALLQGFLMVFWSEGFDILL